MFLPDILTSSGRYLGLVDLATLFKILDISPVARPAAPVRIITPVSQVDGCRHQWRHECHPGGGGAKEHGAAEKGPGQRVNAVEDLEKEKTP